MTRARIWAPWTVLVVVVIAALAYAQSAAGQRLLTSAGLNPAARHDVAFSFTHVDDLPYSAVTGSRLTFEVTIDSHEGAATRYRVFSAGVGSTTATGFGAVTVPDGESRVVRIDVPFTCVPPTSSGPNSVPSARVVFTLAPFNESITHTMYCRAL